MHRMTDRVLISWLAAPAMMFLALLLIMAGPVWAGSTSQAELNDFATRYAAAWSSQEPAALAAFYSEDGSITVNDGAPAVGRAAIEEKARGFMSAFPDMVVRLVELRRDGDRVEFHWRWTGTNTGPGGTGAAVDLRGYESWSFGEDGLIKESLGHYDAAEYERQVSAGQRSD